MIYVRLSKANKNVMEKSNSSSGDEEDNFFKLANSSLIFLTGLRGDTRTRPKETTNWSVATFQGK